MALQQTALADYRQALLDELYAEWGDDFHVYVGREYFDPRTTTRIAFIGPHAFVHNFFLLGRRLLWQRRVVGPLLRVDVAIVEFNPRILSTWAILILRYVLSRRTVLWGHAWSRRGKHSHSEPIRSLMRRLSNTVLVYTQTQREELLAKTPSAKIIVAPNALYKRTEITPAVSHLEPADILFTGRLASDKKPRLLLRAFLEATASGLSGDVRLVFAGDGPELQALEDLRQMHPAGSRVHFLGHVQPIAMRTHYERAITTASPGCVGLSLIQSHSFGLPMLIARDEPHAPEIEAAIEGFNATYVRSDDVSAWAGAIVDVSERRDEWLRLRNTIADRCANNYSIEAMASGFRAAVAL